MYFELNTYSYKTSLNDLGKKNHSVFSFFPQKKTIIKTKIFSKIFKNFSISNKYYLKLSYFVRKIMHILLLMIFLFNV